MQSDQLHRYIFTQANVRGELVQLQQSYAQILSAQDYPPIVQQVLGELLAATSLLTATLKFEGDIALQLQSEGFLKYAVVNGTHNQKLRGVARWDEAVNDIPESFSALFKKGLLVITITPSKGEAYQGMVSLDKPTLAECIEDYFTQSEQLATRVILKTRQSDDNPAAGGLFLQVLPTSSEVTEVIQRPEFEHLDKLTETIKTEELLDLPATEVLRRLYHQEDIQLFDPMNVVFQCSCSRERSANAIASVDLQELLEIVREDGYVKLNCQYCHAEYKFDAVDVEAIHAGGVAPPSATQ